MYIVIQNVKKVKIVSGNFFEKIDKRSKKVYNRDMEKIRIAIIGGGASGLVLANLLGGEQGVTLFERGERLGRKLSATGNGQGNLTNLGVDEESYFSVQENEGARKSLQQQLACFGAPSFMEFFEELGVPCIPDARGRVYPASRQASALTDALRFALETTAVQVQLSTKITELQRANGGFVLTCCKEDRTWQVFAQKVVLCVGGKAAKNFGTDGSGYALATGLGHTLTPLYPSLVQIKTQTEYIKSLKGSKINGTLRAELPTGEVSVTGDILFTEYGVSGDAVFRLSAFIVGKIAQGCRLHIDFLPEYTREDILALLQTKRKRFPTLAQQELLFGVVNNQVGRAIFRRAQGELERVAALVKDFSLPVTGSLGFEYAQVTKGGIPLQELDEELQSKLAKGLYFTGEVLDVDGQCGGFNLQWAYTSACVVARSLLKGGGQV